MSGDNKHKALFAVTGAERPYLYDLPQVLSLPPNFEFRFRYRCQWLDAKLRAELAMSKGQRYVGSSLYLFFHSRKTQRLLPLRKCRVVALETFGNIGFLRFAVEGFPAWPALLEGLHVEGAIDDTDRECSVKGCARSDCERCLKHAAVTRSSMAALFGRTVSLTESLPTYLSFPATDPASAFPWSSVGEATSVNDVARDWGHAIDVMTHSETDLGRVPFFHLLGFQKSNGKWQWPVEVSGGFRAKKMHGYELVERERYRLRMVEWRRDAPEHSLLRVRCLADERFLALEGATALVLGKYDVPEFTFSAVTPGYGELAVVTEVIKGDQDEWPDYYARVPIKVRRNRFMVTRMCAALIVGIALFALPHIARDLPWETAKGLAEGLERALCELLGLMLIYVGAGSLVAQFAQMGANVGRLPMPGAATAPAQGTNPGGTSAAPSAGG